MILRVAFRGVLCAFLASCSAPAPPAGTYEISGKMEKTLLEGGCWKFVGDDGQQYELFGEKSQRLLKDGMRARLVVKTSRGVSSICMVGKPVDVIDILDMKEPR